MKRIHVQMTAFLILFAFFQTAFAKSSYLTLARQRYARIAGTRLDACTLCHSSVPSLNAFGQAYGNNRHDFAVTDPLDSDADGFSNISEINALTFPGDNRDLPQTILYFPAAASTQTRSTGFAITNTGASKATVVLSIYQNSGQALADGPAVSGYRIVDMAAHSQTANLAAEIFGAGLQLEGGWVRLASAQAGIRGFFLNFDNGLTVLDGTDATPSPSGSLLLPELRGAEISIVNPNEAKPASVDLYLIDDEGRQQNSAAVQIPPNGRYVARADTLFPPGPAGAAGYIKINASPGVAASETFGLPNADFAALRGIETSAGSTLLYAPQFAAGGGTWKSALTLINLESAPTRLTLSLVSDTGASVGKTASFDLGGNARLVIKNPSAFGLPANPASLVEGYIRIESIATRVSGFVSFGDLSDSRFQTSLPCVSGRSTDLMFSQVANNDTWFTGLAAVNPNSAPADLTISAFQTDGTPAGTGNLRLEPNGRSSKLLSELVAGLPPLSKGYFTVHSTQPILGFAVFGTHSLSVLSAVPSQ